MTDNASTLRTSIAAPLFDLSTAGYFTSAAGYTNARYIPFTDSAKHLYSQIFSILSFFEIEYYVFAGTLVGYVRNGRMPSWMDDIDIMIFEKDIPAFEKKVAPYLLDCGFNCKIVGKHYAGGGYHILALQQGGTRSETISFSTTKDISVPWVQFDVFFSEVDNENFVRNKKGWGLYHRKDLPLDWVMPPQTVEMDDMVFTTFANVEADVMQEYGDVQNELVVKTHNTTFLSAAHLEWDVIDNEFTRIVQTVISPLTPSLSSEMHRAYAPVAGKVCVPSKEASFDEIISQIIKENTSEVQLRGDDQIYWVMDIKRLAPDIRLSVNINSLIAAKRAAHLRQFIDVVTASGNELQDKYEHMVEALKSTLGDQTFPGGRNVVNIL